MAFVDAYSKKTGKKHVVPEHFLDHRVLGKDLARTPRSAAAGQATPADTKKTPATPEKGAH